MKRGWVDHDGGCRCNNARQHRVAYRRTYVFIRDEHVLIKIFICFGWRVYISVRVMVNLNV